MSYTKGPWKSKRLATYQEPGCVVLWPDKDGQHMRRLDCQGNFTEADANLIAAAPELLEALESMLTEFNEQMPGIVHDEKSVIMKARQAISKAKGQS